jgi:hypothetical protein
MVFLGYVAFVFERKCLEDDGSHLTATKALQQSVDDHPSSANMGCGLDINREPLKNAKIATTERCLLPRPCLLVLAAPDRGHGKGGIVLAVGPAIAVLHESVQRKVDVLVLDSAPDFQPTSRDAALAVLDREKDIALYETTIRIRVIGEFRKSVDPGIAGQFALRCRPVWPTARLNIQIISLDGGAAAFCASIR